MTTSPGRHSFRRLLSALLVYCLVTAPWICCLPVQAVTDSGSTSGLTLAGGSLSASAAQAAELLGVRADVDEILALRRGGATAADAGNLVSKRARVLRKLFHAVLQVQAAENRLESEMSYTYDVLSREQRRINTVNQFFNMMNFMQFGVLYTIEPYSRMHKQFKQSAICTSIGAGLGIGLPVMCIFYNKLARASHLSPPDFLSHVIDGQPVDGSNMPPLVVQYLDATEKGESRSRRACLSALWKERYGVEMARRETLCGIADGKPKSTGVLNTRIVLLWSLYTVVQGFNRDLLALLNEVRDKDMLSPESDLNGGAGDASITANLRDYTGLSAGAAEAARLLRVKPLLDELKSLQSAPESDSRVMQLRICLLESVLAGYLDVQIAADKCQEEMNYQYDVVLAQMMARRGRFLQKTFEANFIQSGTLGACAGWSYLNGYTKAGSTLNVNTTDFSVPDYYVIDLRAQADFDAGHIKDAHIATLATVLDEAAKAGGKKILLVCYTGQTAARAVAALRLMKYEAYSLKWGMCGWHDDLAAKWKSNATDFSSPNWVTSGDPVGYGTFSAPTISTSLTTGEDILKARVQAMLTKDWSVAKTDVLTNPGNYFIVNKWPLTSWTAYGHISGAYRLDEDMNMDHLSYLDPSKTMVVPNYIPAKHNG
ncbi:MAG TPA: rhodanese-like domain-containing protein, partial [Candidatus Obscuribacter sp.]|nr:rhodanese-like domain-containing protein [Candidatus Obscuribacter sp.]